MSKSRLVTHLQLSILISVSLFLVTLTFKGYFFYTPFGSGFNLLSFLQFLTILGWILLIASPPLFLASEFKWSTSKYWGFMVSVSLWTFATLMIKFYTLINFGSIPYQYLVTFPIMIYFEWIIPILYVYIGYTYYKPKTAKKTSKATNRVRFDDEDEVEPVSSRNRERFDD